MCPLEACEKNLLQLLLPNRFMRPIIAKDKCIVARESGTTPTCIAPGACGRTVQHKIPLLNFVLATYDYTV